jgi:hypothetical protein
MAEPIDLKNMLQGLEDGIEARFGTHLGYQQVRAALEKKGPRPDPRSMIMDSRAVFAGDNKPVLLAAEVIDNLDSRVKAGSGALRGIIDGRREALAASMEKNRALLENRAANIAREVKADEAMFVGRLAAEDGSRAVAGAKVILQSSGAEPAVIAEAVTDANGEYVFKLGAAEIKKATKSLTISYEAKDGTLINEKKKINLSSAMGNARVVDAEVPEDKKDLVADLVKSADESKQQALLEMAELKKTEAQLNQISYRIRGSAGGITKRLTAVKELFAKAG